MRARGAKHSATEEGAERSSACTGRTGPEFSASEALARLTRLGEQPPCIVLLGDSNSGKTTLANLLLGSRVLPTSAIPNTRFPMRVRHAETVGATAVSGDGRRSRIVKPFEADDELPALLEIGLPTVRLKQFEILDTPGGFTAAQGMALDGISSLLIPVWCTSAPQAWKDSERRAWIGQSRKLRRHALLAVTRMDFITTGNDRDRLFMRLREEAGSHFDHIFGVPQARGEEDAQMEPVADLIARVAGLLQARRRQAVERLRQRILRISGDPEKSELPPIEAGASSVE